MTKATTGLRRVLVAAALLIAGAYGTASAQVLLDMSLLKCKDYLEAPPDRQELIAAWMSGYFNA
jgi:acid stress chaperone HdeB